MQCVQTALLALAMAVAIIGLTGPTASAQNRVLSPMLASANQTFNQSGFYYGTLPTGHPESRQAEFVKVLQQSGIRAIRFPGGTLANLFLRDDDSAMRETLGLTLYPETDKNAFTSLWQFLEFCRQTKIEPIVQLNTVLWSEGGRVYRLVDTNESSWNGPKVIHDPSKRDAAARAVTSLVREVSRRGYRVQHWELGNEEYGLPIIPPNDYVDMATRLTRAIRQVNAMASVWITLGDSQIAQPDSPGGQWANDVLGGLEKSDVAHDPRLGFTLHYASRSVVDAAEALVAKHGMTPRFAMTEFHLAGNGAYSDLSPRFGYAIELAKYLVTMAADPRLEILCIHDLVSQNFGMLPYNQRSYGPPDMTTWDPSLGYRQMPSAQTYGLFSQLIGGTCVASQSTPERLVTVVGTERRIFVVNPELSPKEVFWDEAVIGCGSRHFECVSLTPRAQPGVSPLCVDQTVVETRTGQIVGNSLSATLPATSVGYYRCFGDATE